MEAASIAPPAAPPRALRDPLPRTATPDHFKPKLYCFNFKLADAEMAELQKLNPTHMRVVNPPHAPVWDVP